MWISPECSPTQTGNRLTTISVKLSWVLPDSVIRAILRALPIKRTREIMRIRDTMARRSLEIVEEKQALLEKGDSALAHQVGEGRDIMSICR